MTLVVDASVIVNALVDRSRVGISATTALAADPGLHAPQGVHLEVVGALRRLWMRTELPETVFQAALERLEILEITIVPVTSLLPRIFQLRSNVGAFDAAYVALAESLACPLVTADQRLARAPGIRCEVRLLA